MTELYTWMVWAGAAGSSWLMLRWIMARSNRLGLTDVPNRRSSHRQPVPRGGGAAFVVPVSLALLAAIWWQGLAGSLPLAVCWLSSLAVGLTGWLDDKYDLSQVLRFGIEAASAVAVAWFVTELQAFLLPGVSLMHLGAAGGGILAFVWITGTVNIFNFMDGVDGMAVQQSLAAAGGWAVLGWLWEVDALIFIGLLLLAVLLPFLWFNRPPARIFMGDTGSLYLGFVFAVLPLLAPLLTGRVTAPVTLWTGAIMIWPFLFDGTWTILRRLLRGENLLRPHRSHLYQRLHIAGWSQGTVSLLYFGYSVCSAMAAILFAGLGTGGRIMTLGVLVAISLLLVAIVSHKE